MQLLYNFLLRNMLGWMMFFLFSPTLQSLTDDNGTNGTMIEEESLLSAYSPLLYFLSSINSSHPLINSSDNRTKLIEIKKELDPIFLSEGEDIEIGEFLLEDENISSITDQISLYHTANIYATIENIWEGEIMDVLPPFDQNVILDYVSDRNEAEETKRTLLSRLWRAIRSLFQYNDYTRTELCEGNHPSYMRNLLTSMDFEKRKDLIHALEERNYTTTRAIESLRKMEMGQALGHYYQGMIERQGYREQEQIRRYFRRMNDTFAFCYNPLKNQFNYWNGSVEQ